MRLYSSMALLQAQIQKVPLPRPGYVVLSVPEAVATKLHDTLPEAIAEWNDAASPMWKGVPLEDRPSQWRRWWAGRFIEAA